MGHAWCKEKTSKAQDSKSPLDRVFLRCAHRIYPSLKEEGSVLGGATQRVTSSEIGYAGSPPRDVLARGRIDSVDRPFHPSDWVDVNLEVPSPPRASSPLTNSTADTSLYPATTPTSSCSNLKDVIPVPPPRRKKINRGRPLPPKPDEIPQSVTNNLRRDGASEEPLYLSVSLPKTNGDDREDGDMETRRTGKICSEDPTHEGRRMKEIYEHKVNGTGKIISSEVVSGRRTTADKKTWRSSESGQHHRKVLENEEYERFAGSQTIKDSSTPNRQDRRKSKELEQRIRNFSRDDDRPEANTRTKNYSTVSLPNYDELDVSRHPAKSTAKDERGTGEKMKSRRPVRSSTGSLPVESFLSPFSEKTSVRLEDYIPRRGSIEHLSAYQVLGKLGSSENEVTDGGFMKYDPSKLEDWDLSDISNCDPNRRLSAEYSPQIYNDKTAEERFSKGIDVVDYSQNSETKEAELTDNEFEISCVRQDMTSSLQKPESFGKASSPFDSDRESKFSDDWLTDRDRYFEPPKMSEICHVSPTCELAMSPVRREPFFLNEERHRSALDTIGGSCRNGTVIRESDRSGQSRLIFGRSLSNESEPYDDPYESKELRAHSDVTNKLIRTISEESLPQEMLEGVDEEIIDFFDEKQTKDTTNELKKEQRMKTPPPSPEPKIKAQILDNDHSNLLRVLNDEAANESNLSSMTPSLTELEAALSDMLEKEDQPDEIAKRENTNGDSKQVDSTEKLLEPKIIPIDRHNAVNRDMPDQHSPVSDDILVDKTSEHKTLDQSSVSSEQILGDSMSTPKKRKESFCPWEEKVMMDVDLKNNEESEAKNLDIKSSVVIPQLRGSTSEFFGDIEINSKDSAKFIGEAPEKPSRMFQNLEDVAEDSQIPTPPRRKNKSLGSTKDSVRIIENYSENPDPDPNDRLI
ncbi:hypothetical protein ACFW04_002737 [Cataglyphis niger]